MIHGLKIQVTDNEALQKKSYLETNI